SENGSVCENKYPFGGRDRAQHGGNSRRADLSCVQRCEQSSCGRAKVRMTGRTTIKSIARKAASESGPYSFVPAKRASSRHFQWQSTSLKPISRSHASCVSTSRSLLEGSSSSQEMARRKSA